MIRSWFSFVVGSLHTHGLHQNEVDQPCITNYNQVKKIFFFIQFTGACKARFDGMSVISVTYSMCPVYNVWDLRTPFKFLVGSNHELQHSRRAVAGDLTLCEHG